ncbi:hypothetical protein GXW82_08560 [Streptacidiphilus sp. 4-A2]|nr:hypothetical protein [Streptacidiphilus sp. 4-A2]
MLLRLYPSRYRAAHGEEIAEVHAEATAGLSGLPLLREHASLAAHALRLRTRLGSTDPAGRIVAGAAPFALAGAASYSLVTALYFTASVLVPSYPAAHQVFSPAFLALACAETLPWIAATVCALAGRRAAARVLLLAGTAWKIAALLLDIQINGESHNSLLCMVALGVLAVAAPPDLVDVSQRSSRLLIGTMTLLTVPPILVLNTTLGGAHAVDSLPWALSHCWPALPAAAAVLVVLSAPRPDRLRALGIALSALPWVVVLMDSIFSFYAATGETVLICAPLVGAALLGTAIRLTRARLLSGPLGRA